MRILYLLLFIALPIFSFAQIENELRVDLDGNLYYEPNDQFRASFSTDLFGDKIYKDNRGNEVIYSKKLWEKLLKKDKPRSEDRLFFELIRKYRHQNNVKEKCEVDILGDIRYENNQRNSMELRRNIMGEWEYSSNDFRATLGKDIFENVVYKDNRGNRVTYSKEFINKITRGEKHGAGENMETHLFLGLTKDVGRKRNYSEEYSVNIFGDIEYKNSDGRRITIKKDMFRGFEYKDNQGMSLSIRRDIFGNLEMEDNNGNKWSIERDIFGDLRFRYDFKECATLKKDIFDEVEYQDNKGNKIKYSKSVWEQMVKRHGNDEKVFSMLLKKYWWDQH